MYCRKNQINPFIKNLVGTKTIMFPPLKAMLNLSTYYILLVITPTASIGYLGWFLTWHFKNVRTPVSTYFKGRITISKFFKSSITLWTSSWPFFELCHTLVMVGSNWTRVFKVKIWNNKAHKKHLCMLQNLYHNMYAHLITCHLLLPWYSLNVL